MHLCTVFLLVNSESQLVTTLVNTSKNVICVHMLHILWINISPYVKSVFQCIPTHSCWPIVELWCKHCYVTVWNCCFCRFCCYFILIVLASCISQVEIHLWFIILLQNLINVELWVGLLVHSASISSGQWFLLCWPVVKKYQASKCWVCLPKLLLPFLANEFILLLSWNKMFLLILYPCSYKMI